MIFLGGDPDLHTLGLAAVDEHLKPIAVAVLRVPDHLTEQAAVLAMIAQINTPSPFHDTIPGEWVTGWAVESQEIYRTGPYKTPNPRSLLHLGHVSGALACRWHNRHGETAKYLPRPQEWKGSVDKLAHQKRILVHAGMADAKQVVMGGKDPYISLVDSNIHGAAALRAGDWKHVMDAVGLAQYAAVMYAKAKRIATALRAAEARAA